MVNYVREEENVREAVHARAMDTASVTKASQGPHVINALKVSTKMRVSAKKII